jgi:hypothetical protein
MPDSLEPAGGAEMPEDAQDWFDPSPFIKDSHKLIDPIGEWPSFDDAELIRLTLDRPAGLPWNAESNSPTLTMTLRLAETGYYLAEIRFNDIRHIELTEFRHQNEFQEIVFDRIQESVDSQGSFSPAGISAEIIAHCGLRGRFEFQSGVVLSVVPCDQEGRPSVPAP